MLSPKLIISIFVLFYCAGPIKCHPGGAPSSSCTDMLPDHDGSGQSNDPFPFEISLSKNEIFSNETVEVTIKQLNPDHKFKGFLAMGFNSENENVVGQFKTGANHKLLNCFSVSGSAATHKEDSQKQSITLEWSPPAAFNGTIVIKATVLEELHTYWAKQPSALLKVIPVDDESMTTVSSSTFPMPDIPDVYSGCGSSKGCLVLPASNCIEDQSCSAVFTHKKLDASLVELELYSLTRRSRYFAAGFSSDPKMGDDSVVECLVDSQSLSAYTSFNHPKKYNERIETPAGGFRVISASYIDGFLYCKLHFPISHTLHDVTFDLNSPYFVLMAFGPSESSYIEIHDNVKATSKKIELTTSTKIVSVSESSSVLKQLHGSFMVLAWLISGTIALLMPRYFRKTWIGVKFQGKDMWFVYHQGLMFTTWLLTMIGFILIFIDVGGWVSESIADNPHPLLGCITTGLAFIQPIMAYFRPAPNTENRKIFNWTHSIVGHSAHVLALTCIFLAVEMEEAELPFYTYWFLTAHVLCYVIAQISLSHLARKNASNASSEESKTSLDEPGSGKRKLVLMCLVTASIGLGSIVIGFIIVA